MHMPLLSRLVQVVVLLSCLVGFLTVVSEQVRTYLNEDTTTSISYRAMEEPARFKMPVLVFCPQVKSHMSRFGKHAYAVLSRRLECEFRPDGEGQCAGDDPLRLQ